MSFQLSPDAALRKIPVLANMTWHCTELSGGLTNRNFKVDTRDSSFVLRLDTEHTASFQLDRELELTVRSNAHAAGLGAAVVHAEDGILLSEYLPGTIWQDADLADVDKLASLAALLKRVHAMPGTGKPFIANNIARQYASAVSDESGMRAFAGQCQEWLGAIPSPDTICCCHNDIVAANIVELAGLKLLDWEYACDNDPLFDLAAVIGFHDLGEDQVRILVSAYAGGEDNELSERLRGQIRLFNIIQWLWFAARHSAMPNSGGASRLQELQTRIITTGF